MPHACHPRAKPLIASLLESIAAFGSFLGDWNFVSKALHWKADFLAEIEYDPHADTDHDAFDDDYVNDYNDYHDYCRRLLNQKRLRALQLALPSPCLLTNVRKPFEHDRTSNGGSSSSRKLTARLLPSWNRHCYMTVT